LSSLIAPSTPVAAALAPAFLHGLALATYASYALRGIQRLSKISSINSTERCCRSVFVATPKKSRRWIPRDAYDLYFANELNAVLPALPLGHLFLASYARCAGQAPLVGPADHPATSKPPPASPRRWPRLAQRTRCLPAIWAAMTSNGTAQ
jgi:hypothetical protein